MSEEDRRELIARQHRALYGDNSQIYTGEGPAPRSQSQDVRVPSSGRGASPLAFDPYGTQAQSGVEGGVQMPPRDRAESVASPASNAPVQQSFGLLGDAQNTRTSTSSPGASPPLSQGPKGPSSGVAPIGTRPLQTSTAQGGMTKRSTTPLTPSSLSYGFTNGDGVNVPKEERSTSAASNAPLGEKGVSGLGGWSSNSAVGWGSSKNTLAVQPSVWG